MNIELDVYRTYHISGPILTTITMNDLVEDSFSLHSSVCDDSTFHFGGMSSASIKFETTKLTYGDNNTKIPWKYANFLVKSYTEDGQGNRTYKYLGVFFTQGVTEKANHSRVEITAYDIMWLLRGKDDTAWYNNFVSGHSGDVALSTFINAFAIRISNDIRQIWDHGNVAGGTSIDPNTVYDDTGIYWRPNVLDDKGNSTPLLSGTIYTGKILKDFCEAFGYNVYADFRYSTSVSQYIRLRVRDISTLLSGQNVKTLSPTQYCDMEYETNDVSLFTNVQVQALNKIYNASNTTTRNYGISNNIFTNLGTQYYEEVSGDLKDENTLHAQRLLANLQNFVYRPCTFTTYEDLFDLTDQVDVTLPDGTTFRTFIMQKDIKGIGGAKYIYTCLPMENYNDDAGYTDYYDGSTSFSVDDTYPTVTEATSRTNLSVGDSFKTIIGKIKKFFSDLKTVAFTGSYNDLSDKPTSLPASDVYPWAKEATKPSYSYSEITGTPTIPTNANYLERGAWWVSGSGQNIDSITSGIHFVYTDHGAPVTGTLIAFSGTDAGGYSSSSYCWQMILVYTNGGGLYVRNRNGDTATWGVWRRIARADEIPSSASEVGALPTGGGSLSGVLAITSASGPNGYTEGIRINRNNGGYTTLLLGGASNSTSGISDGAFWIGCGPTSSHNRKLFITHNGSTDGSTYFLASSANDKSPDLYVKGSRVLTTADSVSWSGGQISNSGIAYANANNEIGWIAGFGSQGYLKLTGGRTSGKTGLLDVVSDTWVLEGANSTSGYNKWIYHGKLGTNRFQCGTLAFSAAGSNSVTFSGAFGGVPVVSLTVQGNSNVYVRTYSLSASAMYITVSGACTVHWMAYYNA